MIVTVDYGMGNLGSILNMLRKVGAPEALVSSNPADIERADKLILPGVGAFNTGMLKLRETGLIGLLKEKVLQDKTPTLGVCLGMQLMGRASEEGELPGLGVPVIACEGAGKIEDFRSAVKEGGASACAAGSMVVYFGRNRAVLINFPEHKKLESILGE